MNIRSEIFGSYNNQEVLHYILENKNGMVVKIMELGATITSITIPDKEHRSVSIACGFDSLDEYLSDEYKANSPYFVCTVGRYCSQIKDAKFDVDGKTYFLATNGGNNNLHGGKVGFDKRVWKSKTFESESEGGVFFSLRSTDGEEGFPGNVDASVSVKLTNDNEIVLDYMATTDKITPFSMTNHSYFNLSGFKTTVEDFKVQVFTNQLQEMDSSGAGTGKIVDVGGTVEDLRKAKRIKDVHKALGDGFEHFYVFDNLGEELKRVAIVCDEQSGRSLEVFSTEPVMLFYTGKYTSDQLQRNVNERYGKYRGFACETHRWQNGPNIAASPKSFLRPGETFKSTTVFKVYY